MYNSSATCSVSHPTTEDIEMKDANDAACSTASVKESTSKEEPQTSHNVSQKDESKSRSRSSKYFLYVTMKLFIYNNK